MSKSRSPINVLFGLICFGIIYGSLFPFQFSLDLPEGVITQFLSSWRSAPSRGDILGNIALFVPFGLVAYLLSIQPGQGGEGGARRACTESLDLVEVPHHLLPVRGERPHVLGLFGRVGEAHGVALGLFDRLKPDPVAGPNQGKLNLKLTGTLPLVGAIRIMALRDRVEDTGTLDRISGLHARGVLDDDEQDYLCGAYGHISAMLLRQQLEDYRAGLSPGNHVPLEALSERERDMLVDSFKAIRALRSRLREELTGEIF